MWALTLADNQILEAVGEPAGASGDTLSLAMAIPGHIDLLLVLSRPTAHNDSPQPTACPTSPLRMWNPSKAGTHGAATASKPQHPYIIPAQ